MSTLCVYTFRTLAMGMLVLGLVSSQGMAGQDGEHGVVLERDLATAKKEALGRGVPLLVFAVSGKDEEATLRLFTREWFAKASRDFLVVLANPDDHGLVRRKRIGMPRYIVACKVFGQVLCGEHRDALVKLTKELKLPKDGDGNVVLPQLLLLAPDMRILSHWGMLPSEERMLIEMQLARRSLGRDFAEKQHKALEKQFLKLKNRFMKFRSARLKMVGNELMAMPYPAARRFLFDVTRGLTRKTRRPHRVTALQVVSLRGSYDALPVLIHALEDSDRRIREAGLEGLSEVRLRSAAKAILEKSKSWKGRASTEKIAMALIRSAPKSEKVRAWFELILKKGRAEERLAALNALLILEQPDETWIRLVNASTKVNNRKIQDKAARVLAAFESRK